MLIHVSRDSYCSFINNPFAIIIIQNSYLLKYANYS